MSKTNVLYTGGSFDMFHYGHVKFLKQCRALADTVIVSLNSDAFMAEYKRTPVFKYSDRKDMLQACKYVDYVIENVGNGDSTIPIIASRANIVAIGSDWANKDYYEQMGFTQEWLDERGISLVYLPYTEGISTTKIINKLKNK